jgi:hypothetical protein
VQASFSRWFLYTCGGGHGDDYGGDGGDGGDDGNGGDNNRDAEEQEGNHNRIHHDNYHPNEHIDDSEGDHHSSDANHDSADQTNTNYYADQTNTNTNTNNAHDGDGDEAGNVWCGQGDMLNQRYAAEVGSGNENDGGRSPLQNHPLASTDDGLVVIIPKSHPEETEDREVPSSGEQDNPNDVGPHVIEVLGDNIDRSVNNNNNNENRDSLDGDVVHDDSEVNEPKSTLLPLPEDTDHPGENKLEEETINSAPVSDNNKEDWW